MTLRLLPLRPGDLAIVRHITVAPEQLKFSGTVEEAFEAAEEGVDFHAAISGQNAVGFFKIDTLYATRFPFVPEGDLGLRAFIVDRDQQGQGIATGMVRELPTYLGRHYPRAPAIWLTVNEANPAALRAYLKGGFDNTSREWLHGDAGPQHILRMAL